MNQFVSDWQYFYTNFDDEHRSAYNTLEDALANQANMSNDEISDAVNEYFQTTRQAFTETVNSVTNSNDVSNNVAASSWWQAFKDSAVGAMGRGGATQEEIDYISDQVKIGLADPTDWLFNKSIWGKFISQGGRFSIGGLFGGVAANIIKNLEDIIKFWNSVINYRQPPDPLVLDLDGDGIETRAVSAVNAVMYDYNGNEIKTNTGWVSPDDGFLVFDRNGNGAIDNASELFSDYTPLYAGGQAADGFAALAQEDTNNDGIVNNLDANWNNLRVWQDINSDGISQSEELFTMEEAGISGLNVAKSNINQNFPNGNSIKGTGTYIKSDGTTGLMGDVYFAVDTTSQQFPDTPVLPEVEGLPNIWGSGLMRDLHQAASLSPQLRNLLTQYSEAATRQEQMAIIDQLLYAWANTSGMATTLESRDPEDYRIQYDAFGSITRSANIVTGDGGFAGGGTGSGFVEYVPDVENPQLTESYRQLIAQWSAKLHILEAFNGSYFFAFPDQGSGEGKGAVTGMLVRNTSYSAVALGAPTKTLLINFRQAQLNLLNQSYELLKQSVYQTLFYQTRFQTHFLPLLDHVELVFDNAGQLAWDYSGLEQYFADAITADPAAGMSDLLEFNRYVANYFLSADWNGNEIFADYCRTLPVTTELQALYNSFGNYLHILPENKASYSASSPSGEEIIASLNTGTTIHGSSGNDILIGSTANDRLFGGSGDDYLSGDAGDDLLSGMEGNDTLKGGAGRDKLFGGAGNDIMFGGAGNDTLYGREDNDVLFGDEGHDELYGGTGDDILFGGDGNDWIYGEAGNDTLDGGSGNDYLYGGKGNDTYVFGRDYGADYIHDVDATPGNVDTILLNADILPDDVTLRRDYNDLVLIINGTADKLTIGNWFWDEAGAYQVERIQFADGTLWDVDTIKQMMIQGTPEDDTLIGYFSDDIIRGLAGNDKLYGRAGDDTIEGGTGNDSLYGEAGNDLLLGGDDIDYLSGGEGDDTLDGGTGNDYLYGGNISYYDSWYRRWRHYDTQGNDTYLFGYGSGQDTVVDYDSTPGNIDTILLKEGVSPSDVALGRIGENLVLSLNGSSDSIAVIDWFWDDVGAYQVEHIQFADGTLWDAETIKQMILQGTPGDDLIRGYSSSDVIRGLAGNDKLYGRAGDDTIEGGTGNDSLYGEAGNDLLLGGDDIDYLSGGEGDDTLDGGSGHDSLYGGTGNDILFGGDGNDWIYGEAGNDTLDGGSGNDYLYGGKGNDTYVFGRDYGADYVYDPDNTPGNVDTILLNADIAPDDVTLRRDYNDLVLTINGTTDKLTVGSWFADEAGAYQVEHIQFADGTLWDAETIKQMILIGTPGDDVLYGYSSSDVIRGLAGNDKLYGRAGDDTIEGGTGNDSLYGEVGNDTYLFGRGSGQDTIVDYDKTPGNLDTILLGNDVLPADVTLRRHGDDLVLSINDTSDTVTVSKWFLNESPDNQVEQIQFADGTLWNVDAIKQIVLQGTPGDDLLIGYSSGDVLDGGAGNDTLIGGKGDDTYIFGRGYGQDIIIENDNTSGNIDLVSLAEDVLTADVTLKRGGNDLILMINDTSDRLQIKNWFASDASKIEYIRFADGTIWDAAAMNAIASTPTETDDYLVGTPFADVIDGGGGNDVIYGLAGNDTLYGGTGNDTIDGGDGDNVIYGGDGNDYIWVGYGNNLIYGDDGDDHIWGGGGNDTIYGGTGNDYIWGGEGSNFIYGGDGNDNLYGGYGFNVIDGGAGNDYIEGIYGVNHFIINQGDGFDDITVRLEGEYGGGELRMAAMSLDSPTEGTNTDAVFFGEGITPESLRVQVNDGGINGLIQIAIGTGMEEGILIDGWVVGGEGGVVATVLMASAFMEEPGYGTPQLTDLSVKRFVFADGRELTLEQIIAMADGGVIGDQYGTEGNDFLLGSVAYDWIGGADGDDWIDARDNGDYINGGDGNDVIDAGSGDDWVDGGYGDDIIAGGQGDDYISGYYGNDVYCFNRGDGKDYIDPFPGVFSGETDTLSFGVDINPGDISAYADTYLRYGYRYGDLVLMIAGSEDSITIDWFDRYNEGKIANVQFIDENGQARIFDLAGIVAYLSDEIIAATAENPISLFTEATSAFELTGSVAQAGGDHAVAYAQTGDLFGVPTYHAGSPGDDVINGRSGDDTIDGGEGNNIINAGDGNNIVTAGAGDDVITTGKGNDIINTGGGRNIVSAGDGDDLIIGGPDGDVLDAGAGNDTIIGGGGYDYLIGGPGDDTYHLDLLEDNWNWILIDDQADATGGNRVIFGEGIVPDDLSLWFYEYEEEGFLGIEVGEGDYGIELIGFNPDDAYGPRAVNIFEFADGQILTYEQLIDKGFDISGTEGDDLLVGTSAPDRITAFGGNDVLIGGRGNDVLDGGSGNDTYIFNLGDGVDTIIDKAFVNARNVIEFGAGITLADLSLAAEGNTLIINVGNSGDALRLEGFDPEDVFGERAVDIFRFADGTAVRYEQLITMKEFIFSGTAGDDVITGTSLDDIIKGNTGNDTIYGGSGNDIYVFNPGDGVDTIHDEAFFEQSNALVFGPGISPEDLLLSHDPANGFLIINIGNTGDAVRLANFDAADPYGPRAIEYYHFADGQVLTYDQLIDRGFDIIGTAGDDNLVGTATVDRITGGPGNDTLAGGGGFDILAGGAGDDTYVFNLGDGIVVIDDVAVNTAGNTLEFGVGITLADIRNNLSYSSDTLIIRVGEDGDEVHLTGFNPDAADTGTRAVQTFIFSDGTIIDYEELVQSTFIIHGDHENNYLTGTNVGDRLYGHGGYDTLVGGDGDDVLTGGSDDDYLIGSNGNDTYVFNIGDGVDTIEDVSTPDEGNMILFGDGITPEDLLFVKNGNVLTIHYGTEGDAINLLNFDQDEINGSLVVRTLEFADGTQRDLAYLLNRPPVIANLLPDQTTLEDEVFSFTIPADTFADPDLGDILICSATLADGTALPSWLTFDLMTMTFSGTPTNDDVGTLSLKVTATDNAGARVSSDFNITVENVNDAPTVANPIIDQTTMEDAVFNFTIPGNTFADVDVGDTLTYSATLADGTALPSWLTFDLMTMTFSGTPTNDDVGTLSLKVTATDNAGARVSSDFNITVENVNDAPFVVNPIADQSTLEDSLFSFTIPGNTFADIDVGDTLTYSATLSDGTALPAWLTFDPEAMTFSGTPTSDNVGTLSLRVTATDAAGASISDDFDITIEEAGGGQVITYGTNKADLIITGKANDLIYALNGNDLVYSGGGNDTVYGGNGSDMIFGGSGNDKLYGDNGNDILNGDSGNDELYGGNGNDILYGGAGNDVLDGGHGNDILYGGSGDDTYIVDNPGDVVIEFCNQGTDTVRSSINYTLGSNVENLILTGSSAINGTGNALQNILTGNSANNILNGNAGNDTLDGGAGNDTLDGGTGSDTYLFRRTDGRDTINDYSTTTTDVDTLKLTDGITSTEPVIVKQNGDLYIFVDGSNYVKIASQFASSNYGIERLEVTDGQYITRQDIEAIVNTMSSINNDSGMDVMQKYNAMINDQQYLNVLAESWK
jgi:Ca2+-binding RTX toxin-like protein